jgi:DNA polymerase-3 subunit alpha
MEDLTHIVSHFSGELSETNQGQNVTVAGEICQVRPYQTRNGKAMGFATLEDVQGAIELVIFPRVWHRVNEWLEPGIIVQVEGKIDQERGDPKVLVDRISQDISASVDNTRDVSEREGPSWGPPDPPEAISDPHEILLDEFHPPSESTIEDTGSAVIGEWDHIPPLDDVQQEPDPTWAVDDSLEPTQVFEDNREQLEETPVDLPIEAQDSRHSEQEARVITEVPEPPQADLGESLDEFLPQSQDEAALLEPDLAPFSGVHPGTGGDLTMVKVFLRSTGDKKRDSLRMRRVYGLLTTYPGSDRFAVYVFEGSRRYHLEFPNETTGFCPELNVRLQKLVGEANIQIEPLRLQ